MNGCFWLSCLALTGMLSTAACEADSGARVLFPVVLDSPAKASAEPTAPDGIAYQQTFRSEKAIRLVGDLAVTWTPPRESGEVQTKLAAGTLFVLARTPDGDMYCAASSANTGVALSYLFGSGIKGIQDAGVCVRDSKNDGSFDQQIVVDQSPIRTRVPYEIVKLGTSAWKPLQAQFAPAVPVDIPAAEIRVTYAYSGGGLFKKPSGKLHVIVCWPPGILSTDTAKSRDDACANFGPDSSLEGITIGVGAGAKTQVWSPPFRLEAVSDKNNAIIVKLDGIPASGPATLIGIGRLWRPEDKTFQRSIFGFLQPKGRTDPAMPDSAAALGIEL